MTSLVIATCIATACVGVGMLWGSTSTSLVATSSRARPTPRRERDGDGSRSTSSAPVSSPAALLSGSTPLTCGSTGGLGSQALVVVVGASITAGYGSTRPSDAWPYILADTMGWRVVVRGVPGAGYLHKGRAGGGPLIRELEGLDVLGDHPALVILQAGHDDSHEPTAGLERAVVATVGLVQREAPSAKLVLVTVFPGRRRASAAELRTNHTIISTALRTDPHAIVINPIAQHWHYRTIKDHLHPTDAGDRWIAGRIARDLVADGVAAGGVCDRSVMPFGPRIDEDRAVEAKVGASAD